MSTSYQSVNAKCPFYLGESDLCVSCCGLFDGSKTQKHTFADKKKIKRYKAAFCDNIEHYMNCEIYRLLANK